MAEPGTGANVRLAGPVNIWFDERQPNEIHVTLNDDSLIHPTTGKDGAHFVVSSSPQSANFDPAKFNTFRALLASFEKPHPEAVANEDIPRRLDRRKPYLNL